MNHGTEMDELGKHILDDLWRQAFEEAAETPPPRVWSAIEQRLDESKSTKILPLWGLGLIASRSLVWGTGIAATVALLLVGWWLTGNQSKNKSVAQLNQVNLSKHISESKPAPATLPVPTSGDNKLTERVAVAHKPEIRSAKVSNAAVAINQLPLGTGLRPNADVIAQSSSDQVNTTTPRQLVTKNGILSGSQRTSALFQTGTQSSMVAYSMARTTSRPVKETAQSREVKFDQLALRPIQQGAFGSIHRIVWVRPGEAELPMEPEVTKSKRESREVWASVSMMPGAFNPTVAVRSAQTSAFSNAMTTSQPSVNSRANFSVAYQAGAGVQLTEHWSVESGIGYLAAHSTVESPGESRLATSLIATVDKSSTAGNLYANALRNSTHKATTIQADYNNIAAASTQVAYNAQNQQTITNNYQYVQVPVQVGYQIRPRKRLSMALLGGLLTNIFVKNTVGDDLVVTSKDGVYRPVSWAATMGARFRYRPSRRWSASLAGIYQPSLGLGTNPDAQVQSHPTTAGMSFGLDYHF